MCGNVNTHKHVTINTKLTLSVCGVHGAQVEEPAPNDADAGAPQPSPSSRTYISSCPGAPTETLDLLACRRIHDVMTAPYRFVGLQPFGGRLSWERR